MSLIKIGATTGAALLMAVTGFLAVNSEANSDTSLPNTAVCDSCCDSDCSEGAETCNDAGECELCKTDGDGGSCTVGCCSTNANKNAESVGCCDSGCE